MKLVDIAKRLEGNLSIDELLEILDILDPESIINIEEVFDPNCHSFCSFTNLYDKLKYRESLKRLYGKCNYNEKVQELEIELLREMSKNIVLEYEMHERFYGPCRNNQGEFDFYEVFIGTDDFWVDRADDIPNSQLPYGELDPQYY